MVWIAMRTRGSALGPVPQYLWYWPSWGLLETQNLSAP